MGPSPQTDTALGEWGRSQKLNLVTNSTVPEMEIDNLQQWISLSIRKSSISLNSIAISKIWHVYSTLSYFRPYILRLLRNGLFQRFSIHLYLFLFLFLSENNFYSTKLVWTWLWHAWTEIYYIQARTSNLLSAPFSKKSLILIAPWNYAKIVFHFENQYTFQNKKCFLWKYLK